MSIVENYILFYGLLFIVPSSQLYVVCGIEVQTNLKTLKGTQKDGMTETFKPRLPDIQIANADSEYIPLVEGMNPADGKVVLDLPEHGFDGLVSNNFERIRKREVNDVVSTTPESTTTVEQVTIYKDNQSESSCHVKNHCHTQEDYLDPCSVIISRADWAAHDTLSASYMNETVSIVFIHHTAMNRCHDFDTCAAEVQEIQDLHMNTNGWDDIGYSFLVGDDGMAYEARGWNRTGAHTRGFNDRSIAIAVMGNFNEEIPGEEALVAINSLINCGIFVGEIETDYLLYGHRDASGNFDSPGHMLYEMMQGWPHFSVFYV